MVSQDKITEEARKLLELAVEADEAGDDARAKECCLKARSLCLQAHKEFGLDPMDYLPRSLLAAAIKPIAAATSRWQP